MKEIVFSLENITTREMSKYSRKREAWFKNGGPQKLGLSGVLKDFGTTADKLR